MLTPHWRRIVCVTRKTVEEHSSRDAEGSGALSTAPAVGSAVSDSSCDSGVPLLLQVKERGWLGFVSTLLYVPQTAQMPEQVRKQPLIGKCLAPTTLRPGVR